MATTTRDNVSSSGTLLQTFLKKKVLENFEPNLYFYQMWEKPMWEDWFNTIAWTRYDQMTTSADDATLLEWITPDEQAFTASTVTVTPLQYWLYVVLSDMLLDVAPVNLIAWASKTIWENMARIIDEAIQANLLANNTNTIYASWDHSSRSTLDSTDVMEAQYLNNANTYLTTKWAPTFNGYYVMIMHPNVYHDLRKETWTGSWLDSRKYATPENIFKGEIWALNGIRVISCAFVKRVASTVTVYPNYVLWQSAYWVATLSNLKTYITPRSATDSDPLAQRVKVGAKVSFNTKILQQDALLIVESASSVSYTSTFNPTPTA